MSRFAPEQLLNCNAMNTLTYSSRFDSLLEGIQIIGFDWTYLYLNDVACRHSRFEKSEIVGKCMMDVYPGIERTELYERLKTCMQTRSSSKWESHFTYEDGEQRWFDLSVQADEAGLLILSIDITQHKLAEHEIAAQSNRFRALIEKGVDMKTLSEASGAILYASPSIFKLLGYETTGRNIFDLIHPDDIESFKESRKILIS